MVKDELLDYLYQLNNGLNRKGIKGELHIYGGAVMCLVFNAREDTHDIDGWFRPSSDIRELIEEIADRNDIDSDWLNDGVKGFISENDEMEEFLVLSNLTICYAVPEYVLAMKCMASRIDADSRDVEDIKFLINYLHLNSVDEVINIILKYFNPKLIHIKTQLLLEELFENEL